MLSIVIYGLLSLFWSDITISAFQEDYFFALFVQKRKNFFQPIERSNRVAGWTVPSENKEGLAFWWINVNAGEFQVISRDTKATFVLDRVPNINGNATTIACPFKTFLLCMYLHFAKN